MVRNARTGDAFRISNGDNRDDHGHEPIPEREEFRSAGCRGLAGGRGANSGHTKMAGSVSASFFEPERVDRIESVSQAAAEATACRLAAIEGVFCGISAAGACVVALRIAREVENATIVFIVCDRGDRYLSTGAFPVCDIWRPSIRSCCL